jgi:hypothetical protein
VLTVSQLSKRGSPIATAGSLVLLRFPNQRIAMTTGYGAERLVRLAATSAQK